MDLKIFVPLIAPSALLFSAAAAGVLLGAAISDKHHEGCGFGITDRNECIRTLTILETGRDPGLVQDKSPCGMTSTVLPLAPLAAPLPEHEHHVSDPFDKPKEHHHTITDPGNTPTQHRLPSDDLYSTGLHAHAAPDYGHCPTEKNIGCYWNGKVQW